MQFSANLGFLWADLPIPDAIHAAHEAGFAAVECHFPYETNPELVAAALRKTGLRMLSLNTRPADRFGLAAVKGSEGRARRDIEDAILYAVAINCSSVHVLAGQTGDETTFRASLDYACRLAMTHNITILIEPLNPKDVPGYHLCDVHTAIETIKAINHPNLKLMFDCYHVAHIHGDIKASYERALPYIGHVQMAGIPNRNEPDFTVMHILKQLNWTGPIGAEYTPKTTVDTGLAWMRLS